MTHPLFRALVQQDASSGDIFFNIRYITRFKNNELSSRKHPPPAARVATHTGHLIIKTLIIKIMPPIKKRHQAILSALVAVSPIAAAAGYPTNYPPDTEIELNGRSLQSIALTSPSDGAQTIAIGQDADGLLYHDATSKCFAAAAGESVTASFNWTGGWMHGYVYLDRDNDGSFDYMLDAGNHIADPVDVMAYSNFNGRDSAGANTADGNVGVNPPGFTIPADLAPGLYRMRYKVDWNSIDPGGNTADGALHGQTITANHGAIADALVYVHPAAEPGLRITAEKCAVTDLAGNPLEGREITPGKTTNVLLTPDEGYRVVSATIESGTRLDAEGVEFANPSMTYKALTIPLSDMMDNIFEIPADYTYGKVALTVKVEEGSDPALDYYSSALEGTKDAATGITSVSVVSEGASGTLGCATTLRHSFVDATPLAARTGYAAVFTAAYAGTATELRLLADLGQTGSFDGASTASAAPGEPISLDIPAGTAPGVYRARLEAPGECDVDFLLNIHDGTCAIYSEILNGNIWGHRSSPLPLTTEFGKTLRIVPAPTLEGFAGDKLTVRHGHNVFGRQYLRGNRQWDEFEIPAEGATDLTAEEVDGSIYVFGAYYDTPDGEWTLVWSDEFAADGMDTTKWSYHPRYGSAWNRFCAIGDGRQLVNVFDQGMYRSYCVRTPDECMPSENQEMVSGAIHTAGKFYLNGGYVEARCKTLPHSGNFQAFWMMPVDQSAGWPSCGEIDIWEQINTEDLAYGSLHHAWRYPADSSVKNQYGPISKACPFSGSTRSGVDASLWHTYAIDWDSEHISWYVDGVKFATATNPHYSEGKWTEAVTWPFDKHFYIICNQSVGNGSWAANPDLDFAYRTDFDYVRAYQKKDRLDYYSSADGLVSGIENVTADAADDNADAPVEYYNLQGMKVPGDTPGVYIRRQGRSATKVLIR